MKDNNEFSIFSTQKPNFNDISQVEKEIKIKENETEVENIIEKKDSISNEKLPPINILFLISVIPHFLFIAAFIISAIFGVMAFEICVLDCVNEKVYGFEAALNVTFYYVLLISITSPISLPIIILQMVYLAKRSRLKYNLKAKLKQNK